MDFDATVEDFTDDLDAAFQPVNDRPNRAGNSTKPKTANPFQIMSVEEIKLLVDSMVDDVQPILDLPATITRILLTHYKWKSHDLIDDYYENGRTAIFEKVHVVDPFDAINIVSSSQGEGTEECKICCCEVPAKSITGLQCGHTCCDDCWNQYLTVKIDEGVVESISCIDAECKIIVDDENVMKWVKTDNVRHKYHRFVVNSFVDINQTAKWCPGPGCSFAARTHDMSKQTTVVCACLCGYQFCFGCAEMWHEAITCQKLKRWLNEDDSETRKWIAENAKECPGCHSPIEKNGGCMHMTCGKCKHEFCWTCMGLWRGHQACNRFVAQANTASADVERFHHYRDRYLNQIQSIKLERKLHESKDDRINHLKDLDLCSNETRFLKEAIETLYLCRQTLTYSYVFAYYVEDRACLQTIIFEDNQSDLQTATERLSEYLEHEVTTENLSKIKQSIINSYQYCKRRCDVLLEHVREGKEKKWW